MSPVISSSRIVDFSKGIFANYPDYLGVLGWLIGKPIGDLGPQRENPQQQPREKLPIREQPRDKHREQPREEVKQGRKLFSRR